MPLLVEVTDKDGKITVKLKPKNIIIATGGRPRSIPGIDIDGTMIIEYRKAMSLEEQPKSMIIVGAGAIGIEFAYFYNQFGTKITIIEMLDTILPIEDREVSDFCQNLSKKIKLIFIPPPKLTGLKNQKAV